MASSRRLWIIPLAVIALAWAAVLQDPGPNQNAHLALVTAIAHGTPRIDAYEQWTRDDAYVEGHFYTAKAPGLALATVPYYLMLEAAGLVVHGPPASVHWPRAETLAMPRSAPWQVALWGAALPFFILLLLVRGAADRLVPGYGTIAAVTLGAGSLVGVFATVFFDHELSALLGFAAFGVLMRDRSRHALAGGLLAGLAIGVEFPLGIIAVVLALYAQRRAQYLAGVAAGLVPLLVFNTWAGGRPWSLAYSHAVLEPGKSGHDVLGANGSGFFGVGLPSLNALVDLLLSAKGLLVLTPVWALAALGIAGLRRRGHGPEAAVIAAVTTLFLLYDAAYYLPFGGFNAGPRFLVPILPFLALGLAAAWRDLPGPTLMLGLTSVVVTTVSILADPMLVSEDVGTMYHRIVRGGDHNGPVPSTVFHWLSEARVAPLLIVGAVALAAVAVTLPRRLSLPQLMLGAAALVGWRVVYVSGPLLIEAGAHWWLVAPVLAAAVSVTIALLVRDRAPAALPAVLLAPLAVPQIAGHTAAAAAVILMVAAALVVTATRLPRAASPAAG